MMRKKVKKLKDTISKIKYLLTTLIMLPFIYGCGSGDIFSGALGGASQFAGGGGGSGGSGLGGGGLIGGGGGGGNTIINPEPATMLLMGGGMMAMAYYKEKINRKNKK